VPEEDEKSFSGTLFLVYSKHFFAYEKTQVRSY